MLFREGQGLMDYEGANFSRFRNIVRNVLSANLFYKCKIHQNSIKILIKFEKIHKKLQKQVKTDKNDQKMLKFNFLKSKVNQKFVKFII